MLALPRDSYEVCVAPRNLTFLVIDVFMCMKLRYMFIYNIDLHVKTREIVRHHYSACILLKNGRMFFVFRCNSCVSAVCTSIYAALYGMGYVIYMVY